PSRCWLTRTSKARIGVNSSIAAYFRCAAEAPGTRGTGRSVPDDFYGVFGALSSVALRRRGLLYLRMSGHLPSVGSASRGATAHRWCVAASATCTRESLIGHGGARGGPCRTRRAVARATPWP